MKIAIMGSAPSSVQQAPFADKSFQAFQQGPVQMYPPAPHADEEWEIWGCSPGLFGAAVRATRWFELHRWEPGKEWFSPQYCQFLHEFKGPVYVGGEIEDARTKPQGAVIFPIGPIEDEFSAFFLTSSLALMHALAILTIEDLRTLRASQNVTRHSEPPAMTRLLAWGMTQERIAAEMAKTDEDDTIGLWGVDMSANEEYSRQRPGCWFFALQTMDRGIALYYPPESDLLIPEPIYGLSEWDHEYIKATARVRELTARKAQNEAALQKAAQDNAFVAGAIDDSNYWIKGWMGNKYALPAGKVLRREKKG